VIGIWRRIGRMNRTRTLPTRAEAAAALRAFVSPVNLLGLAALVWWVLYWRYAILKSHVKGSPATWFEPFQFLSLDFLHNYQAVRFWFSGGDPFHADFGDPIGRKLCYPPAVLLAFAWCRLVPVGTAVAVWTIALGAFAALGATGAWYARRGLNLTPVPYLFALAAIVGCAPAAFALERGNYDLLLVPFVLLAACGLRRSGPGWDAAVGFALAAACCLKIYPGLLLVVPVLLRRWRALGCAGLFAAALLAFQPWNLPVFVANLRELSDSHRAEELPAPPPIIHSIPWGWQSMWEGTRYAELARIPGPVAAGLIVGGLLAWIGVGLARCPDPRPAVLPALLWTLAAATFVPKVANDYSLVFLPMAMLAVWDRRDPLALQAGLVLACLVLQPVSFPMSHTVVFGFKLIGLGMTAACLARRLSELRTAGPRSTEGEHAG
jgi:hypothetical protein